MILPEMVEKVMEDDSHGLRVERDRQSIWLGHRGVRCSLSHSNSNLKKKITLKMV
jgi:hypothetical protein